MRQGESSLHLISVALAALLSVPAAAGAASSQSFDPSEFTLPPDLGYVLEVHPASPSRPTIIHLQEAHTNYEAQQHLIGILQRLVEQYGVKLILVEGGAGDVSLAYMRRFGPPANRKQVADKYLKLGILSAEEYLDITSDHPLTLWGVEQKALYDQNVEAFLTAEALQESLQPVLASVREATELLKSRLFGQALLDLEAKAAAFEDEQLGLGEYAAELETIANRRQIGLEAYPNLARFLEARHLEQVIHLPKVQQEQKALLAQLSQAAPQDRLEALLAKGRRMKDGTAKPAEFYGGLEQLASASKVDLTPYPNLASYIRYVTQSAEIQPTALSDELDACAASLRQALISTPEGRQLSAVLQELDLVAKLLGFDLSPQEYRSLDAVELKTLSSRWEAFLNEQLARVGLPSRSLAALGQLDAHLPTLQRFYEIAHQRDERLVQNAVAKLTDSKEPLAVLITGGFHSPRITNMLTEQGIGTVVVTPKVSTDTDERLYRTVVKYKRGRASLRDVMAVADPVVGE